MSNPKGVPPQDPEKMQAIVAAGAPERLMRQKVRAAHIAELTVIHGMNGKEIAQELGIRPQMLYQWKNTHRDLMDAAYADIDKLVHENRLLSIVRQRDGIQKRSSKALQVIDEIMESDSLKEKRMAAQFVLGKNDPEKTSTVENNVFVFSSKTAGLLTAAFDESIDAQEVEILPNDDEPDNDADGAERSGSTESDAVEYTESPADDPDSTNETAIDGTGEAPAGVSSRTQNASSGGMVTKSEIPAGPDRLSSTSGLKNASH